jgi:hypothetical protein
MHAAVRRYRPGGRKLGHMNKTITITIPNAPPTWRGEEENNVTPEDQSEPA